MTSVGRPSDYTILVTYLLGYKFISQWVIVTESWDVFCWKEPFPSRMFTPL